MIQYQYLHSQLLFFGINPHEGSFNRGVPFANSTCIFRMHITVASGPKPPTIPIRFISVVF